MNALGTALSCLLLASLAAGASLTAEARGIANQQNLRITGGKNAGKGLLPFQVALFEKDVFFCSGTILSNTWVLTSAKCIDGKTAGIEVRAGLVKLDDTSADVQKVASAEHIVNEHFEPEFLDNDVALIKLATPLTLGTKDVNSITLPTYADAAKDPAGRDVLISGWGRTADTMTSPSNDLKYATVTLSANSVCEAAFGNKVIGTKICLDTASSKPSACIGDAGGPVAAADLVTGEKSLFGIVSFGFEDGCQKDTPVVFTRVSSFLGFIGQKTDIVIMDNPPAAE